jgi:hypothetical protein
VGSTRSASPDIAVSSPALGRHNTLLWKRHLPGPRHRSVPDDWQVTRGDTPACHTPSGCMTEPRSIGPQLEVTQRYLYSVSCLEGLDDARKILPTGAIFRDASNTRPSDDRLNLSRLVPRHKWCGLPRCVLLVQLLRFLKNAVFWDATPCGSCRNRRSGGT